MLHLNRKCQDRYLLNHPTILSRQDAELLFWSEGSPLSPRGLRPNLRDGLCHPGHVGWEVERLRSFGRRCRMEEEDVQLSSHHTLQDDQQAHGLTHVCQTVSRPFRDRLLQHSSVKAIISWRRTSTESTSVQKPELQDDPANISDGNIQNQSQGTPGTITRG